MLIIDLLENERKKTSGEKLDKVFNERVNKVGEL